jgi:hypothetical protein
MGFLFGLMVGGMLASGAPTAGLQTALAAIPLRCFAALDIGDAAYRDCRRATMMVEINRQSSTDSGYGVCWYIWRGKEADVYKFLLDAARPSCDVEAMLTLEIKALRQIEAAQAQKK